MQRTTLAPFNHGVLHPVFAQNLPEGSNRRYITERLSRYASIDDMYFLALQGDNGIGMLSYRCEFDFPTVEQISLSDILHYKGDTPLFPQLLEKFYLRNMVAGFQPKVLLSANETFSLSNELERTVVQKDVIVKASENDFPLLTINEFVCMEAARYCGLDVPKTFLSDNFETFVIERFDMVDGIAFGYEDFTTLMKKGPDPSAKYSSSCESLLKATMLYTNNIKQVEKIYTYIVFNCLIGNGDAHLKNYALQYAPDMRNVFVSPLYDVTHTQIYATKFGVIDDMMALKISKSKTFPDNERLLSLGAFAELSKERASSVIESIGQGIKEYLAISSEVTQFEGLRASIEASVNVGLGSNYNPKGYVYDRRLKFPPE
jgi:serine/threonine-protein kinase HipA